MDVQILHEDFRKTIYGFSGIAANGDYVGTAFRLMDNMWEVVKGKEIKNKGMNVWVYEEGEKIFAGVELDEAPPPDAGLERKDIHLASYAYYKHVGPYYLIKQAGQKMNDELRKKGVQASLPYLEIYGHWTPDEGKLETELITTIK